MSEYARRGAPHDHTSIVDGCFRCELGQDEVANQHYLDDGEEND